jgi:hypothetical protein
MTPIRIAGAAAAICAVVLGASHRDPDPPVSTWPEAPQVSTPKADRLPLFQPVMAVEKAAEIPAPVAEPPKQLEATVRRAHAEHRERHRERDLCERHHLRKVWVSERRWRCRRR